MHRRFKIGEARCILDEVHWEGKLLLQLLFYRLHVYIKPLNSRMLKKSIGFSNLTGIDRDLIEIISN